MMMEKREVEGSSGFMHALSSMSVDPKDTFKGDERFFCGNKNMVFKGKMNEEKALNSCSSSSSSIGKNSDISDGSMEKTDDSDEVQSSYKGPLSSMEALQEVLPIRKGISRFYNGKSKSFTSLREASTSSSMKEIAKPENAYIKKRRNILACGLAWESNKNRGGISKRVTNSSRTSLALAAAMNCSSGLSNICEDSTDSFSRSPAPFVSRLNPHFKEYNHNYCNVSNNSPCLSPLARGNFSGWRSFSLADLQQCEFVSVTTSPPVNTKVEKEPT
ncbi:protein OXIDATIVE STRESS 3 LIKE 1 [Lycium ferocissimum]|uniref:protein OXIDATIVE STRESS 3 LIKE 1 n=1 Tax=Lycium ferocissimum TaxID=112874 RepID=UPI002815F079|nr:protein OXIDATIVE STRESS 3 LIKE 1 [Lycium ferocissimum]